MYPPNERDYEVALARLMDVGTLVSPNVTTQAAICQVETDAKARHLSAERVLVAVLTAIYEGMAYDAWPRLRG